jgi:DNA (cytosine-5)-methyltransferase 1
MNHDNTTEKINHLSLCTGYEGIGMGLRTILPNLREVAFVEREGFCCANLEAQMEKGLLDEAPIYTDLKTFPYRKFRGKVSILSGGFPCQPFSQAGLKKATEDPRHLFPYIAKGIEECQPRIVFLENVEGILSCKTGEGEPVVKYVGRTLEKMGYRTEVGIFSASEVGAPHQRKRVFILGYSEGTGFEETEGVDEWRECQSYNGNEIRTVSGTTSDSTLPELGYTEGRCDRQQSSEQQRGDTLGRPSETELGDTSSVRCSQYSEESREACTDTQGEERRLYESKGASTLPNNDAFKEGISYTECQRTTVQTAREHASEQMLGGVSQNWPARPNERQYEWEEPRVIQVEPRLGGKSNGYSTRVDRLRALGNGVVPATAAKAFLTLINRIL